jgi:hypothetical protein
MAIKAQCNIDMVFLRIDMIEVALELDRLGTCITRGLVRSNASEVCRVVSESLR